MSNEKMRAEFEAWAKDRMLDVSRDGVVVDYARGLTDYLWSAWQASREALVIELPQQSGVNLDWNQAIRYCHQAIESAGAKVKP